MSRQNYFWGQDEYRKLRGEFAQNSYDYASGKSLVYQYKDILGRCLYKFMYAAGISHSNFLDMSEIKERFSQFDMPEECIKFISCVLQTYENEKVQRKFKYTIKRIKKRRIVKKRFCWIFKVAVKEMKTYGEAYRKNGDWEEYKAMREGIIILRTIVNTCYIRKIPLKISKSFYDMCCQCDGNFELFYEWREGGYYILTENGRQSKARQCGGMFGMFEERVIWLFIYHYLHLV